MSDESKQENNDGWTWLDMADLAAKMLAVLVGIGGIAAYFIAPAYSGTRTACAMLVMAVSAAGLLWCRKATPAPTGRKDDGDRRQGGK